MARTTAIGVQDFETRIVNDYFYVDKTHFIKEWWESGDSVTLITRPRRFGKTLNMSMLERFFLMKFKVHDAGEEKTLQDTVQAELQQIQEKKYEQTLIGKGISQNSIRKCGFVFPGKKF